MDTKQQILNWTHFCGHGDDLIIWNTTENDLGQCFQTVCLHFPLLTLLAVTSAYYCGKHSGWVERRNFEKNVLRLRYFACLLLFLLPVLSVCYLTVSAKEPLVPVQYFISSVECLTWLTHFVYILALRHRLGSSLQGPWFVCAVWVCNFVVQCWQYSSLYARYALSADGPVELRFATVSLVLQCVYGLTLLPSAGTDTTRYQAFPHVQFQNENSPLLSSFSQFSEDNNGQLGVAEEDWGVIPRLTFSWVNPLMAKGLEGRLLSTDDLYDLPDNIEAHILRNDLNLKLTDCGLFKALHVCFWKEFYGIGILKLISDVSGFFGPLLLNKLVTFIENKSESVEYGYLYAASLCGITLIGAFCSSHFNYKMAKVGLKIRGAIISVIYSKVLSTSTFSISAFSTGQIINFMSTDTDRIVNSCSSFHAFWSLPFQIGVTLYLLHQQVGNAFLAGLIFSLVLIPINKCIASKIGSLSTKLMEQKDNRVKETLGVLRGMKTVKLHVWEDHFIDKISDIRTKELRYLKGRKYLDALCVYFWATTPVFISILTFSSYVLMGNKLTAATVFTTIALLNMLISPLNAFPWVLNGLTEAWVSLKRVEHLLQSKNSSIYTTHFYQVFQSSPEEPGALIIKDGNFNWGPDKFKMYGITFYVAKGEFAGVFGPVGCGKSSLLAAFLAEMDRTYGVIGLTDVENGIAYCPQTPWLQRGTIKDNILFGKEFDRTRYNQVLDACALTEDIENMSAGDLTGVGEGGSNLSGGQRARVALARAVYQDCNIYLLDDVFSAVDPAVAAHILTHCINGLLKHKTRVVCTHQIQFLLTADSVAKMSDNTVKEQGAPADVLPDYEEILTTLQLEAGGGEEKKGEPTSPATHPESAGLHAEEHVETREVGTVAGRVYKAYLRAVGYALTTFILVSITLMQVSRNGTDFWIAHWVTQKDNTSSTSYSTGPWFPTVDPTTKYYLTIYVLIAISNSVFTLFRAFLFAYGGIHAASKVHQLLLEKIVRAKTVFFDIVPLGQILNRFSSDIYTVDDSLPFIANILLAQLFGVCGTLVMMVYGLPYLVFLLVPLLPLYNWLQNHYRLTSRELKRLGSTSLSPLFNHFSETIEGRTVIRALQADHRFQRNCEEKLDMNQKAQLASQASSQWLSLRLQFIGVGVVAGVSILGAMQHHLAVADPGLVGLAISYALGITGLLGGMVNAFTETEREMVAVERVDQYLREVPTEDFREKLAPPPFWLSQGIIAFNNVTLKYRDHIKPSLDSVSFCTRPAERIGVVGRTGAGKSSLLAALFRLTELHSGEILIDSVNISHIGLMQLRSKMAVIPQETALFTGTVRDNVDPLGQYSDGSIWTAIHSCNLSGVVRELDTPLSLSTGQAQLLCLVRAVLHNAKILCVDEATANVDEETDRVIQRTLRDNFRGSTVITIAHRVRTIMDYDRVLVMGNGTVVEFDTPDNLLQNKDSHFYQLVHQDYE